MPGLSGETGDQSLHNLGSNVFIKEANAWGFFRVKCPGTRPLHLRQFVRQEGKVEVITTTRGRLEREILCTGY